MLRGTYNSPIVKQIYNFPVPSGRTENMTFRIENVTPYTLYCNIGIINDIAQKDIAPSTAPYSTLTFTIGPEETLSGFSIWVDSYPLAVANIASVPTQIKVLQMNPTLAQSLVSIGITSLAVQNPASSTLLNSLMSYYTMDELSGTRYDSTTGGRNLTQTGTVPSAAGKLGKAAVFDVTVGNYLTSGFPASLDTSISVSAWLYLTGSAPAQGGALFAGNSPGNGIQILATGAVKIMIAGVFRNVLTLPDYSTWHHVVWTKDGSGAGTQTILQRDNFADISSYASPASVGFGGIGTVGNWNWGGAAINSYVDELGIWSRALLASEQTSLWNAGAGYTWPFSGLAFDVGKLDIASRRRIEKCSAELRKDFKWRPGIVSAYEIWKIINRKSILVPNWKGA